MEHVGQELPPVPWAHLLGPSGPGLFFYLEQPAIHWGDEDPGAAIWSHQPPCLSDPGPIALSSLKG